jgi:hypothetical protein
MKNRILCIVTCLVIFSAWTDATSAHDAVVSVPYIRDRSDGWSGRQKSPVAAQVISELLNNYDCIICNRSGGV